jgi:hypothetical protein
MRNNFASILIAVFIATTLLMGCSSAPDSKDQYLNNYSDFMKDIEKNKDNFTAEEWQEKDKEFQQYSSEMYSQFEGELGLLEQVTIGKNAVVYAKHRGFNALRNINNDGEVSDAIDGLKGVINSGEVNNAINELKGAIDSDQISKAIDEFKHTWDNELQGELSTAMDELKKVWDEDLKNELSGSLDELKAAIESGEIEAEINGQVKKLEEILQDEEIKGSLKNVVEELKTVLEKVEVEIEK